jgi:hypothetical protein
MTLKRLSSAKALSGYVTHFADHVLGHGLAVVNLAGSDQPLAAPFSAHARTDHQTVWEGPSGAPP